MLTLSEIWIYPIKSLGGIRLDEAHVQLRGLQYDRRWMIVDEDNRFVTQRSLHRMALLDVTLDQERLLVIDRTNPADVLEVPMQPVSKEVLQVSIWDDHEVEALTVSDQADQWLSTRLERPVRLVYMPDSTERRVDPRYAKDEENVSFADGYPFLLIGQSSLDELNSRLPESISMRRFRPNLVVTGAAPFAEDSWKDIQVGALSFQLVKPCARCVLTTVDPETAQTGPEPLKTLATYRKRNNKIYFGQNLLTHTTGQIAVGDPIQII
ncbi:MOSC domain-containing protein [Telluribacter humicola]|uniref:MOSC domain-containing protein n=1 Tax=Telluribacter humicola TaxID=1720261 RepID=UPI00286E3ADB|nr:MOSC N-terminal beta barrel domain-containing protein [Telluribacter humicola]